MSVLAFEFEGLSEETWWCRAQKIQTSLCGSPLAWARSSLAGKHVSVVQRNKTKHLICQQVPHPAITQVENHLLKPEEKPLCVPGEQEHVWQLIPCSRHTLNGSRFSSKKTAYILRHDSEVS